MDATGASASIAARIDHVDVCPYAYYKELPFVGKAESTFSPADWTAKQWIRYLLSRILPATAGSLAAVAVLLLSFCIFVGWRITAFGTRNKSNPSHKSPKHHGCVSGPVWKVTITLVSLAGIALALTGMGIVNRSLMHEGWDVITELGGKTKEMSGAARFLVQESSRLNPIMQQLNQLMDANVDFNDLSKQATCVGNFLANLGDPQQLRDGIAFMAQHLKDMEPVVERLDNGLLDLTTKELPKQYPIMRDVQAARASLYRWTSMLQDYQRRLAAMPKQEPAGKYNSSVVQDLLALHPKLPVRSWTTDVSHIQDKFFQYDEIRKSGIWQALPSNMMSYNSYVPGMATWAIKPVSESLDYINVQYLAGGGGECLTKLVQQVKKIDAHVAQLGNDTKAAFQQVELLESMLRQVYNGIMTPVMYKDNLDALSNAMNTTPNTSSLVLATLVGNQSVSEFPDVPTTLQQYNQARDALAAIIDPIKQVDTALEYYSNFTWNYDSVTQAVNLAEGAVANAIRVLEGASADQGVARSSMFARLLREQGEALQSDSGQFQASMSAVTAALDQVPPADAFLPLLDSMVAYFQVLPADRREVVEPVQQYIKMLWENTVSQPNAHWRQVNQTVSGFGNATDMLENQTTHRLTKIETKWKEPTTKRYDTGYKAVWALYLLLACSLGFLLVSVWMELQWGWPTASLLVLATATMLLVLGVAWSALLVIMNDTCANMPSVIASSSMDPKVQNLLLFYMNPQNSTSDVSTALQEAGILDVNKLYTTLNNATYNLTQGVAATNFTLRPELRDIATSSVGLTSDLSDGIEALLRVADWQSLHGLYRSARSWLCCNVASVAYYQWCFIIAAGMLGWAAVALVCAIIAQNDRRRRTPAEDLGDLELGQKHGFVEDQFKPKAADTLEGDSGDTPAVSPFILRPLAFKQAFAARSSPLTSSSSSQQIATYENDTFEDDANSMDIHTQQSNIPQFSWPGPAHSASLERSYLVNNGSGEGGFMGTGWLWQSHSQEDSSSGSVSGGRDSRQMEALNTGGSGSSGSSSDARGGRVDALHTGSSATSVRTSLSTIFDTIDITAHTSSLAVQSPAALGSRPGGMVRGASAARPQPGMPPRPAAASGSLAPSPAAAHRSTAGVVVTPPRSVSNSSTPLGSPCSFDSGTNSTPNTPDGQKVELEIVAQLPAAASPSMASNSAAAAAAAAADSAAKHMGDPLDVTKQVDEIPLTSVTAVAVTSSPKCATPQSAVSSSVAHTPNTHFTPFNSATSTPSTQGPAGPVQPARTPASASPASDAPATPQQPIQWVAATPAHTSSPCSFRSHDSPAMSTSGSPPIAAGITSTAASSVPERTLIYTPTPARTSVPSPASDSKASAVGSGSAPQAGSTRTRTYRRLYSDVPQAAAPVVSHCAAPGTACSPASSNGEQEEHGLDADSSWLSESSEMSMQLPMPPTASSK